jgi:Ca2+-binding EF-hand superfamily protein
MGSSSSRPGLVGEISSELSAKVSSMLEQLIIKGKDFAAEFSSFDDNFSGAVLQANFREVMQDRFRGSFTIKELELLERLYRDTSDPRKVVYSKMLIDLHPRHVATLTSEQCNLLYMADSLRQKIRKRCDYLTPGELRRPFRHFARTKTDAGISREELSVAIRDLGMKFSGDQENSLFDMLNLDSGRAIHYNHFVVFVCDPFHQDVIWKLRRGVARARISVTEINDALSSQDSNGSGLITSKQFGKAIKSCNIDLSDSDLFRLMLRFDNEDSQRFDIELFGRFLEGTIGDGEEISRLSKKNKNELIDRKSIESTDTRATAALRNRIENKIESGYTHNEVFMLFDPENKGTVDLMSLQSGARELGINLSRADSRGVLRMISLYAGGLVDKPSFFEALGVKSAPNRRPRRRYTDSNDFFEPSDDEDVEGGKRNKSNEDNDVRESKSTRMTGQIKRIIHDIKAEVCLI